MPTRTTTTTSPPVTSLDLLREPLTSSRSSPTYWEDVEHELLQRALRALEERGLQAQAVNQNKRWTPYDADLMTPEEVQALREQFQEAGRKMRAYFRKLNAEQDKAGEPAAE